MIDCMHVITQSLAGDQRVGSRLRRKWSMDVASAGFTELERWSTFVWAPTIAATLGTGGWPG